MSGEGGSVNQEFVGHWIDNTLLPAALHWCGRRNIFVALNTVSLYSKLPFMLEYQKGVLHNCEVITGRPTVLLWHIVDGSETLVLLVTGNCEKPKCFKILLFGCLKLIFVLHLSVIFCFSSV
jgi:hypothetical protein